MHPHHRIRLHGPWQYEVIADETSGETKSPPYENPGTIRIPSDWGRTLGGNFRGRVRYSRSFGKPTGLEINDRVDLVCECVDSMGSVELNGTRLGMIPPGLAENRFEVTQALQTRNQLTIEVELTGDEKVETFRPGRERLPGGIVGEVRLEIVPGV